MGLNQTPVLNEKVVQVGSAAVFLSTDDGNSFVGIGACDEIALTETITQLDGEPFNAVRPRRVDGIAEQTIAATFSIWENDPVKITALRGGIDVLTSTTGTPVTGASQVIASGNWAYDVPFELGGQNASGLVQAITSVTGSVDGALTERDDYVSAKNGVTNRWGISVTDSATVTTLDQTITVVYDYTPASNTKVTTGGLTAAGRVWIRMVNRTIDKADAVVAAELSITEGDNYYYVSQYDIFYCIVNVGKVQTFKNKKDTNPAVIVPISLLGESSPDLPAGANLMEENYYNEIIPA